MSMRPRKYVTPGLLELVSSALGFMYIDVRQCRPSREHVNEHPATVIDARPPLPKLPLQRMVAPTCNLIIGTFYCAIEVGIFLSISLA